jgi:NADH-quinone oxidoreductase subunit J
MMVGGLSPSSLAPLLATASLVDSITFAIGATIVVLGAVGVVISRNPVHAALSLVLTLFGVAVLFVEEGANFLAAVQVIVYAGAIVVLFLFVIMFLGVDREENLRDEPLPFQRPMAVGLVALGLLGLLILGIGAHWSVGAHSVAGPARGQTGGDVAALGRSVFSIYLFPFEITAGLLVVAVVGAVVLARKPRREQGGPQDEGVEASAAGGYHIGSTESVADAVAGTVTEAHGRSADGDEAAP